MNILIIDNSVAFTGAFKCALNEADILSEKHKFVFVLSDKSKLKKVLEDKGYKVYQLHMVEIKKSLPVLLIYPIMLLKNTFSLLQILKAEQIDLIQVNDFYNMLGSFAKKFGYKGKFFTYVRFLPNVMPGILRRFWIKQGLKHSDKMVAVSDAVLKQLPAHQKAVRLYDPIKLSEQLPEKEYKPKETIDFLYLSNYIQGKGQDDALEAFINAYNQNNNLRLTFMGGDMGMQKNADFKQRLIDRVIEVGLSDIISFEPFNANVEEAIKQTDVVLNFSEAESFSMTCLEAAYYGTPLIATRCGGPEEIIDNEVTGLTVPVKDTAAMEHAILQFADDFELRTQCAKAGRKYVEEKFSINAFKDGFNKLLNDTGL